MEAFILLIALAVLATPIIAIILLVQANRRIRDLTNRVDHLERSRQAPSAAPAPTAPPPAEPAPPPPVAPPPMEPQPVPESTAAPGKPVAPEPFVSQEAVPPPVAPEPPPELPPELEPVAAAMEAPPPLSPPPPAAPAPRKSINWERFMGVKLAAWLGGVTLSIALLFFIKYAFEHDLVPPVMQVALGFIAGLGLVVGGIQLTQRNYAVTGQTLEATGVLALYAVAFAARSVYHLPAFSTVVTMIVMVAVTVGAFVLANAQRAQVIAILGMLGGFLTPVLLSTGQDNALALFLYVALLDLGLVAIAARRDWAHLVALGALGTAVLQVAWFNTHFEAWKLSTLVVVSCGFVALFTAAHVWLARLAVRKDYLPWAALIPSLTAMLLAIPVVTNDVTTMRVGWVLTLVFVADAGALLALIHSGKYARLHPLVGLLAFYVLGLWLVNDNAEALPLWSIAAILVFTALHNLVPLLRRRIGQEEPELPWAGVFPLFGLMALLPVVFGGTHTTPWVWPGAGALVIVALLRALSSRSLAPLAFVLVGCFFVLAAAVLRIELRSEGPLVELFALVVTGAGLTAAALAVLRTIQRDESNALPIPKWAEHLPTVSTAMPFLLLVMYVARIQPQSVAPAFLAALALAATLMWVGLRRGSGGPCVTAVLGILLVEHTMHFGRVLGVHPGERLVWHVGISLVFLAFPLVFRARALHLQGAVAAAALAVPGHIFLIPTTAELALPAIAPGFVAALLALPVLGALAFVARIVPAETPWRLNRLAWLGASTLFCLTVAIPIQWSNQWLTLGWALEGAALIALFRKLPHPGLRVAGVVLLCVVFVRLALNEQVLEYGLRGGQPFWNWILAVYGTASAACFAGAALIRPGDSKVLGVPARPLLAVLGTVLAFALMNLQIADYFTSPGRPLELSFSGNFARDMAYTIGWAVFALAMLVAGIWFKRQTARLAALGLLGAALLKLFFHDLAELDQLYRIGALVGVAVVAIVSSWLYQRFLRTDEER